MSLINKLLQDLEARQAPVPERFSSRHVRPLPPAPGRRRWPVVTAGAMLLALVAAGAAYLLLSREEAPPSSPTQAFRQGVLAPQASVDSPAAALAVSASTAPASGAEPSPWTGTGSPAEKPLAAAMASAVADDAFGLRVSRSLVVPPGLHADEGRKSSEAQPRPIATAAASPGPAPFRRDERPPSIEKQARAISAEDRAAHAYREAIALAGQGRPGAALEGLREALRADAAHDEARLLLARLLLENRRLAEAKAVLEEGLARDPAQPRLAMALARVQVELGDTPAASATLARATAVAAGNAEFRGFQAALLQRMGRHREAAEEFRAALRLKPDSGLWWMGLGLSLDAEGERGPARDALQRARATGRLEPDIDRFVEQKLLALRGPG
ncbi:MAG: tetratricopeptide repeat protein [Burkholderiales bacterium]